MRSDGSFSIPGGVLGLVLFSAALLFLLVARTLFVLRSIRNTRQRKDPRLATNPLSPTAKSPRPLKTLVVLGSGGHTTEMLHLIQNLDPDRYGPMALVVAATDTTSLERVAAHPHPLPFAIRDEWRRNEAENNNNNNNNNDNANANDNANGARVYRIPRSREVGQSYWSSILTTLYSFFFAFWLVGFRVRPDLVLVNGPGTCLPIAVSAFFFRVIGWKTGTKIVFVESFCRVTSLSLTGKLLYPIADLFAVCWEQLHAKYPRTYLTTSFIRKTNDGNDNKANR